LQFAIGAKSAACAGDLTYGWLKATFKTEMSLLHLHHGHHHHHAESVLAAVSGVAK
jgi:hypothetical protein